MKFTKKRGEMFMKKHTIIGNTPMINITYRYKGKENNIYAKYENKNRFAYTSAFQTLINARTNKTLCSDSFYIIRHLDIQGIMRQNLNVCG